MNFMIDLAFLSRVFNLKDALREGFSQAAEAEMFFLVHAGGLYILEMLKQRLSHIEMNA